MTKYENDFLPYKIHDLIADDGYVNLIPHLHKISDFLYECEYDNIDYEFANRYMEEHYKPAGCSSVRNYNWYGRNLDWFYDNSVEFVVRVPRTDTRYASIAVCSNIPTIDRNAVEHGYFREAYRILPFYVSDGINEKGVFCNMNVVPNDKGNTAQPPEGKTPIIMSALCRYILDNCSSADDAINKIQNNVAVYNNKVLTQMGYELHFMIGDAENMSNTYILEFINNTLITRRLHTMTNFYLTDVDLNNDNKVYTPADEQSAIEKNKITEHGSGLERWNLIWTHYSNTNSKEGMTTLMKDNLDYRKSYDTFEAVSNPYWYTEFVGGELTVDSTPADFADIKYKAGQKFLNRDRSQGTNGVWHTTHTSIYDLNKKRIYIYDSTEDGVVHSFSFKKYYTADEIDEMLQNLMNR